MVTPHRADRRYAGAVGAIVAVALILRFVQIGSNSFWIDEINVLSFVRSGHLLSGLRNQGGPFEPPLHYLAVWLAAFLPWGFETTARIPAAVFGSVEVLALALFARRMTGRRDVALLAGVFLAVAPFAVRYSQENRYYTTFSALHLLTWWLVVRALQLRTRAAFAWWGAAVALMILSHPFAPLVVLLQVAVVGWVARREHRGGRPDTARALVQRGFRGLALAAVVVAPWYLWGALQWVPDLWNGRSYKLNPRPRASVDLDVDLVKRAAQWLLGNGGRWTLLAILLVVLAVGSIALAKDRLRRTALAVALYSGAFFIALVPLAHLLNTYLAMRRLEFLLPPMVLLAALGAVAVADTLRDRRPQNPYPARRAMAAVGVAVVGLSAVALITYYSTEKTNYRALARVIGATPKADLVVVGPVDERWPRALKHYLDWSHVHRRLRFIIPGRPSPRLELPRGSIVWVTGSPPADGAFTTRALNSVPDLQVIAGDRSAPAAILPWFVSVSQPQTLDQLRRELARVQGLAVLLSPPASSRLGGLFTGR